jgi:hypothetical protein
MTDLTKLDLEKIQGWMPPGISVVLEPGDVLAIWERMRHGGSLFRFRDNEWQSCYALGCGRSVGIIDAAIKATRVVDELVRNGIAQKVNHD